MMQTIVTMGDGDHQIRLGKYRHYKGGYYQVTGLVVHHETRRLWVTYSSDANGVPTIRPLDPEPGEPDGFADLIHMSAIDSDYYEEAKRNEHTSGMVQRFKWVSP